jgi:hypothetical protein
MQSRIGGGVILLFAGIITAGSRGALLAIALTGAALALFGADFEKSGKDRRVRAAAALAVGAIVVFFTFRHVGEGVEAGAMVDASVLGRLFIYGDSWRWWRDTPFFGTGLGSFATIYPSYQDQELRAIVSHAHSDWLESLLESGLAGLLTALVAAAGVCFAGARSWRSARSAEMRALIGGLLAAALAFAAHALFEFCFQIPGNAVFFLVVVGFLLSAPAWADKSSGRAAPRPPSAPAALAAAALFLILGRAALRPAVADWISDPAGDAAVRAAGLARAYAMDPDPEYLKKLASLGYTNSAPGDPRAPRAALAYSLAAAEQLPFDSDALYLAGRGLYQLGRPADGGALLAAAATVRFPQLEPDPDPESTAERSARRREILKLRPSGGKP